MKAQGTVKFVSNKEGKYGIQLENSEVWYNGFGNTPAQKGEFIEFNYTVVEKNGKKYQNVSEVISTKKQDKIERTDKQSGIEETARLRRKTDCLGFAINLVECEFLKGATLTTIKEIAEEFENWVEGKQDKLGGIPVIKSIQG